MNKKIKKIFSIIFSTTLLATNISSFAKVPYLDRYESISGENLIIDNILEEQNVDISIEGNSLVNLADINSSFEVRNLNDFYQDYTLCEISKLKLNTDYTLIIEKELLDNHNENYNSFEIGVGNNINYIDGHPHINTEYSSQEAYFRFKFNNNKKEILKISLEFTNFKDFKYLAVRPIRRHTTPISTEYANANIKLVLLEGDYTDKDIDYFEGIQSVGEKNNKLELKYTNKNLYPYGDILSTWNNGDAKSLIGWIKVKPNTTYTASVKEDGNGYINFIEYYDNNLEFLNHNDCYIKKDGKQFAINRIDDYYEDTLNYVVFTTGSKINYLYVTASSGSTETNEILHSEIMLEEGDVKTEYEPYKETIIDINLNEPLRSIPNGAKDRIMKYNGQWAVERNIGQTILNGSEDWLGNPPWDKDETMPFYCIPLNKKEGRLNILSDKFKTEIGVNYDEECIFGENHTKVAYIRVKKSRLLREDNIGFAEWLANNPVKIVYELDSPIYEPLNIDLNISLYLESTHIDTDSNIPENIIVQVDRVMNNAIYYLELANQNPTIENISNARYWGNMLGESLKKDELQNQINSLTEVKDLKIDKKSATVNTDIYIKFENSISMSLDTNSIVFEDYNLAEDMEKLEAINLTVTSSLPYKLNAYLEEEISNSDNTSIIDKSILNVRLSNTDEYKAFTDLKTPITLLDNENYADNKIHKVDLILKAGKAFDTDVYKTVLKFEVEQE